MEAPFSTDGFLEVDRCEPVSVEQMRMIEDAAANTGISRMLMMENAGSSIARFIFQNSNHLQDRAHSGKIHVLFVAGIGNNGGDVFVAARHLAYWSDSFEITVLILGKTQEIRAEEARTNYEILNKITSLKTIAIQSDLEVDSVSTLFCKARVIVCGLFGTGFKGEPRPMQKRVMQMINQSEGAMNISVDVPSGLEADSGKFSIAVRSDYTITMHAPKIGMAKSSEAKSICGRILIANIGVSS